MFESEMVALDSSGLPLAEISSIAHSLLGIISREALESEEFLATICSRSFELRQSIAAYYPPDLRRRIVTGNSQHEPVAALDASITEREFPLILPAQAASDRPIVLLLSVVDNQDSNRSLLNSYGFDAHRISSASDIETFDGQENICGVILDGSCWSGKDEPFCRRELITVVRFSSFMTIIVDNTGLSGIKIDEILKEEWFEPHAHSQLHLRATSGINEDDVRFFQISAEVLAQRMSMNIQHGDLSGHEARVALATLAAYHKKEFSGPAASIRECAISILKGGRSGAKVFKVIVPSSFPYVLKVGSEEEISKEVCRYKRISLHHPYTKPFYHFHAKLGVILYPLVPDIDSTDTAALTLDDQLRGYWIEEAWNNELGAQEISALSTLIQRVALFLHKLNINRFDDLSLASKAYYKASNVKRTKSGYSPGSQHPPQHNAVAATALLHLESIPNNATVHGDAHLRNILVQGEAQPTLIDFAHCGPGHPAFDLVFLELALSFSFLRATDSESSFVALQRALSEPDATRENLRDMFPTWYSSKLNSVLLDGMVFCREQCLKVLKDYKLDSSHYLAMKLMLSLLCLAYPDLQVFFVRATVSALVELWEAR